MMAESNKLPLEIVAWILSSRKVLKIMQFFFGRVNSSRNVKKKDIPHCKICKQ
jgi:hypothetical protein